MRQRSISITGRLAVLFASVTMVTFAAVGFYLYDVLAKQLKRGDDVELLGKTILVRHLLMEARTVAAIRTEPHPFVDAVFGHKGLTLSLTEMDGRVLVLSGQPSRAIPITKAVPATRDAEESDVQDWNTASGAGRFVSVLGVVGDVSHTPVTVTITREGSDRSVMLGAYAQNLIFAVLTGSILAAVLGFLVVRVGLRPLRKIVTKANEISTNRLNTRLSVDDTPLELRELGLAFNAMLNRLEDGVLRLSQFAADIAHDIRTPINTLLVETQVVLSGNRTRDEYETLLVSNIEEYERLARLVENTLFLARADNAQLALRPELLDVATELGKICDYFEGVADEAGVRLAITSNGVHLWADRVLFQRAVSNLVSNAITHSASSTWIKINAISTKDFSEVSVSNDGAGIAPEHLPHIFERFYRADPARASSTHSSGLGLAIVRAIMVLHRGETAVESEQGVKTVFRLRFTPLPDSS